MLAGCEGRPLPGDSSSFGDYGESEWGTDESSGAEPEPDLPAGDDENTDSEDTGTTPCPQVVESLTITDATAPESVACVEQVLGDLTIGPTTTLVDLSLLSNLRMVGGTLYLFGNGSLTSLHGLEQLLHTTHLHVRRNHELEHLHGLDSLASVDQITVANNEGLLSIAGLPPGLAPRLLDIEDNDLLTNLDGLPQFAKPDEAAIHIEIEDNPALTDLSGLSDCCAAQTASILLGGNPALVDLTGLDGFVRLNSLRLHDNVELASLAGLDHLVHVQTLDIEYDHCVADTYASLIDFSGALVLSSVDVLQIQWVDSLTGFAGLERIDRLSKLLVRNNATLPYTEVEALIVQTEPALVDTCGGVGGPACVTEPCPMF